MRHILVVEDNPHMAHYIELTLKDLGYRVTVAADGDVALKIASAVYPDLILLDLDLPLLSGEEVCRSIKHSYDLSLRQIPIVMVTAKDSDVDRVVAAVMGAADYVIKPFKINELMEKVEHLLAA